MKELLQQVDKLERRVGTLESLQNASGGVSSVTGTPPIASSGGSTPAISIAATTTNDGGTIVKQAATPGTTQASANAHIDGTFIADGNIKAGTSFFKAGVEWLGEGTSFPGSPTTNQRYFRTDRGIEYYWDGTRWLSAQIFDTSIAITKSSAANAQATTAFGGVFSRKHSLNGVMLVGLVCSFVPGSIAQSASNFYTMTGTMQSNNNSPVAIALTLSGTVDTKTFTTINNPYEMGYDLSQVVAASYYRAILTLTLTGVPGTFFFDSALSYRLVG
jgi:hypothetical protein